mmetsp:Transcript_47366/g.150143  ORF Transcript_47366/g.150143 Transcript_47366/m.150143 type:complete len:231 (+) Transcript_47366:762-1454(+)
MLAASARILMSLASDHVVLDEMTVPGWPRDAPPSSCARTTRPESRLSAQSTRMARRWPGAAGALHSERSFLIMDRRAGTSSDGMFLCNVRACCSGGSRKKATAAAGCLSRSASWLVRASSSSSSAGSPACAMMSATSWAVVRALPAIAISASQFSDGTNAASSSSCRRLLSPNSESASCTTFARYVLKASTHSVWPASVAICSAVLSFTSRSVMSAPARSRRSTPAGWPM